MREIKEKRTLYITHSGEFLFWLIIILAVVATSSMGLVFKDKLSEKDYQIFLQDADGLIVGSPVRMMGVEVGHVTKIEPIEDEVYIKFILTNPEVYIPQGTNITVEFSGLAGSKSLEIYLPEDKNTDDSTPLIQIQEPKRLHDALGLLNNMFKKIDSIIYATSSFGAKIQSENIIPEKFKSNKNDIKQFLNYSNTFLDDSNKKATEIKNNLKEFKEYAK